MTFTRKTPDARRAELLVVAVALAEIHGYKNVTRDMIASKVPCSTGLVTHRFGTMVQLRRAVMRYAIHNKIYRVIGQGIAAGDPSAKKVSEEIKTKALAAL